MRMHPSTYALVFTLQTLLQMVPHIARGGL
jgi:hypothetical protein